MTSALAWPARVVVLDGVGGTVVRGRPAEFRQRGLALSSASGALDVVTSLGREPASAVVVPADRAADDIAAYIEAVSSLTGTPLIIGVREASELEGWRSVLDRVDVRVVELPLTPLRLAAVLGSLARIAPPSDELQRCGALELSVVEHRVTWHGETVHLAPRPFDVLQLLMRERPRVVSTREVLDRVHPRLQPGWSALGVRSAVKSIRHELRAAVPDARIPLASVYGVGYCIVAESPAPRQAIAAVSRSTLA